MLKKIIGPKVGFATTSGLKKAKKSCSFEIGELQDWTKARQREKCLRLSSLCSAEGKCSPACSKGKRNI